MSAPKFSPTARQADLLRYVRGYQLAHGGIAPSFVEASRALGMQGPGAVHHLVHGCIERGLIRMLPGQARSMELLVDVTVPRAADGAPLFFVPVQCDAISHEAHNG